MAGIIGFASCLLCAFPLFVMGHWGKESREPLVFWTGDKDLKEKVKDVKGYNQKIATLYKKCALAFGLAGLVCMVHWGIGAACILLACTVGLYVVRRSYKRILASYV